MLRLSIKYHQKKQAAEYWLNDRTVTAQVSRKRNYAYLAHYTFKTTVKRMIDFLQPFYLSLDFSSEQRQINSGIEFSLNYSKICADLSSNMVQLSFSQA